MSEDNKNIRTSERSRLERSKNDTTSKSDILTRLWVKSDSIVRVMVKCSLCNGQHKVCSGPEKHASMCACLSLDYHLVACIFTEGSHVPDAADSTCGSFTLS